MTPRSTRPNMPRIVPASTSTPRRAGWIRAALAAGVIYLAIGRLFALPLQHVHAWRLAAWAASGLVFVGHLAFGHARVRATPRFAALHAAFAAALGAFGLAAWAMLRSLPTEHALRPVWLLALVLWPAITAVPAFLVGLTLALVIARIWPLDKA